MPDRYVLYLGTIEPRKNLLGLLNAYWTTPVSWRKRTPLVLAGGLGWGDERFWDSLIGHPASRDVFVTGYVPDAVAAGLIYAASVFVYPSFYEGFGLPPLEAMQLRTPTVVSRARALIEVCDTGAVTIDQEDTDGWAEWMERLTEPGAEREGMIEKGNQRSRKFCWERTARTHHDTIERVVMADFTKTRTLRSEAA